MFVSDIQKEILDMQIDISSGSNPIKAASPSPEVVAGCSSSSIATARQQQEQIPTDEISIEESKPSEQQLRQFKDDDKEVEPPIKNEIKCEQLEPSFETKRTASPPNYFVKQEWGNVAAPDSFDIESEIIPSFIMKNSEPPALSPVFSPMDYLCEDLKKKDNEQSSTSQQQQQKEPYDEWMCIQKELSLMADTKKSTTIDSNFHHHRISGLYDQKANANSPLSDLFNTDAILNSEQQQQRMKSVETRLEAMFGDSSDLEKSNDIVESRLDALFHSGSPSPSSSNHMAATTTNDPDWMALSDGHQSKRQWSSVDHHQSQHHDLGNSPSHPASPSMFAASAAAAAVSAEAKRSCMVSASAGSATSSTFLDSDTPRWLMDIPVHQQQQQQSFDFVAATETHHSEMILKRPWNGVGGVGHPEKKLCFGKELDLDGSGNNSVATSAHLIDNNSLMHHLQADFDAVTAAAAANHQQQQHIHAAATSDQMSVLPNNHNSNSMSNFDDDINRHVQNAIDSILNLQNSESDSLHFSLDHTMNSFLADSPLGLSGSGNSGVCNNLQQRSNNHMNSAQTSSHHHHHHLKRKMHSRLDDMSDCLINGGGSDSNGAGMMADSPLAGNDLTGSVNDFSSGIDEAIKSIITS